LRNFTISPDICPYLNPVVYQHQSRDQNAYERNAE